jgi:LmbE family N-acetylglucosaminyl deacetylase
VLRVWHRRLLARLARDITERTASRSALVLAPHPDDETIGCGATVARKAAAGTRVRVVIAADGGHPVRRAECLEACRRLGVAIDDVVFLGYPDGSLADASEPLDADLRRLLDEQRPDEVYAPCAIDAHPDHRALAGAVDRAVGSSPGSCSVLHYPVWYWNRWAWVDGCAPRWRQHLQVVVRPLVHTVRGKPRVVRTGPHLGTKRAALDAHATQSGLDRSWLELFFGADELFFEVCSCRS